MKLISTIRSIFAKRSNIIRLLGILLLLGIGTGIFRFFLQNINRIDYDSRKSAAQQGALLISKEFELLDQRLDLFLGFVRGQDYAYVQQQLANDSLLYQLLRFDPVTSVSDTTGSGIAPSAWIVPIRYISINDAAYRVGVDVVALNVYFQKMKMGVRGYFELVSSQRRYLISPDSSMVGNYMDAAAFSTENTRDTILLMPYLKLDVLQQRFVLDHFLPGSYIVISVPILKPEEWVENIIYLSLTLTVGLLLLGFIVGQNFYRERQRRQRRQLERANRDKEQTLMRFNQLREQLNPHFLFNTLGSLQQLIGQDQEHAKQFVTQLAKVYRQMLQTDSDPLAYVRDELALVNSYFFLQKVRFRSALPSLDIKIDEEVMSFRIPRMSLQILMENAIKHNEFTTEYPLQLSIFQQGDCIFVRNSYRPRKLEDEQKNGYGLRYLRAIYTHLDNAGFDIEVSDSHYQVCLPLLK